MNDDTDRETASEATTAPGTASTLSLDAVFEVLSDRHRRFVLYTLADLEDDVVPLEELVEEVVTLTAALDGDALTHERYRDIATDLYHWHLPVLADVGIIDCDARHDTVRYLRPPLLETWVDRVSHDELPSRDVR